MDKKKLLLVTVSVGVFLVIVISASILIFTPKNSAGSLALSENMSSYRAGGALSPSRPIAAGTSGSQFEAPSPATVDAADLVRSQGGMQGLQTPPSASSIQETTFYINGTPPVESYRVETSAGDASSRTVINVPRPSTAAVPDAAISPNAAASPVARQPAATPAATKPAPAASPKPAETPKPVAAAKPATATKPAAAAKPAETPKPAAAAKPAAVPVKTAVQQKPAAAAKIYNDYWVQTGAFSSKTNADGVKEKLATRGISSIIENREVEGKTWYRVRVGPYTSESEANYWLSLVRSIEGFADSQIRQTQSVR
jgi:DedD protein